MERWKAPALRSGRGSATLNKKKEIRGKEREQEFPLEMNTSAVFKMLMGWKY